MTSLETFLTTAPTNTGRPTGNGDWRLVVELLVPDTDAAIWDVGLWGVDTWGGGVDWLDVTDAVRGMEWRRGSDEVYGRPRVGQIAVTLDDSEGLFDPWTSPALAQYLGPGTLMRAGLVSVTGLSSPSTGTIYWLPQWTGIVDTWAPQFSTTRAQDRYVEVTLNETLRDLAQVDDPALPSPVGANEGAAARTERLLDASPWPYGFLLESQNLAEFPATNYQLSSTVMAANRIAELYVTADSADSSFRSLRDGRAGLTASEYIGALTSANPAAFPGVATSWTTNVVGRSIPFLRFGRSDEVETTVQGRSANRVTVAYRPETFRSVANDADLANAVTLQSVEGGSSTFWQLDSIAKVGQRSYNRTDLLLASPESDSILEQLARFYSIRRGLNTLRLDAVTVDTWARPLVQFLAVVTAEPTQAAYVIPPSVDPSVESPAKQIYGFVASIVHKVAPRVSGSSMIWTTSVRLDTRRVDGIPGAQFPETPPEEG